MKSLIVDWIQSGFVEAREGDSWWISLIPFLMISYIKSMTKMYMYQEARCMTNSVSKSEDERMST